MSKKSKVRSTPMTGMYEVHWMLRGNIRDRYGKAIRRSWLTSQTMPGARRMVCHHLADLVVVTFDTVADDFSRALDDTRGLVLEPLEHSDLPLPESVVVMAAPGTRARS